jgi:glycerate kinase
VTAMGGRLIHRSVTGPLGRPVRAAFGLLGDAGASAVVETAQAAGLGLVPADKRDPRVTTTFGVGELMRAALAEGVREIIVGLGGSATNDGGAGAMQALGARFLDDQGEPLPSGGAALARLAHLDMTAFKFPRGQIRVIAASDVRNPLTGPDGASAVYGPQKGADADAVAELDAALAHFADIVRRDLGADVAALPGAGAAGGLGASLAGFLGAEFRPGIDVVLDAAGFETSASGADWVLTGEGRIDRQTLSGKTISGLLSRCRVLGIPVLAFGGRVDEDASVGLREQGLSGAVPLVSKTVTIQQALLSPARVLADAVTRTLSEFGRTARL